MPISARGLLFLLTYSEGMDISGWVIPIVIAILGLSGVAVGGWLAARSLLRLRLIDKVREDSRDHRDFQVRAVEAMNELGTASAQVIIKRISVLSQAREAARAEILASGNRKKITIEPLNLSPDEDKRIVKATEAWRSVLAEGHAFASTGTGEALSAMDQRRSELVSAINEAVMQKDISDTIRSLEAAQDISEDLRSHYARQVYRHLQIEKVMGDTRVFQLAHMRRLRTFAKNLTEMHRDQITEGQKLIEDADNEREQGLRAT